MNNDVLECKKKTQELITSDRAPVNGNERKRGYMDRSYERSMER